MERHASWNVGYELSSADEQVIRTNTLHFSQLDNSAWRPYHEVLLETAKRAYTM